MILLQTFTFCATCWQRITVHTARMHTGFCPRTFAVLRGDHISEGLPVPTCGGGGGGGGSSEGRDKGVHREMLRGPAPKKRPMIFG